MREEELTRRGYLIDEVVTMDLPLRKVAHTLHDAAAADMARARKPLCLAAAEKIMEGSRKGDTVFITTGFPVLPKNVCETDGPPGAAVLARTLSKVGIEVFITTDALCIEVVKAAAQHVSVMEYPAGNETAKTTAEELLSTYDPSVLISIERPGWNERQEYHTMRGINISHLVGKTDYLFSYAKRMGKPTVAVGDGGNELGCGSIAETVRRQVPYGARCQCPCGRGIAATTRSDVLVVGGTSNWGAYGITACFSLLNGLRYRHTGESEAKLLDHIIDAGGVDAVTGEALPLVDGVPASVNKGVVDLIWTITTA